MRDQVLQKDLVPICEDFIVNMEKIIYRPIGIINTPFQDPSGMPIQPAAAEGIEGTIILDLDFVEGLQDLEGFSYLILLYHFHQAEEFKLLVKPFLDEEEHGVFATRAPRRPNGIGLSIVKLLGVSENILRIQNVDILNGTPLLDIKPYIPDFDHPAVDRIGWLEKSRDKIKGKKSDDRFVD